MHRQLNFGPSSHRPERFLLFAASGFLLQNPERVQAAPASIQILYLLQHISSTPFLLSLSRLAVSTKLSLLAGCRLSPVIPKSGCQPPADLSSHRFYWISSANITTSTSLQVHKAADNLITFLTLILLRSILQLLV